MPKKNNRKEVSTRKSGFLKINTTSLGISEAIGQINRVIGRFETEVEGLLKKIVKQGERSRKELRKSFDDLITRIEHNNLVTIANETREELAKEARKVGEDVFRLIKDIENFPGRVEITDAFVEIRKNLKNLLGRFSGFEFIQKAKHSVGQTRKDVLGLLRIPSQDEVYRLEKKIVSLEKRLSQLTRKAA